MNDPYDMPTMFKYGYKRNELRPRQYKKYNPIKSLEEAKKVEFEIAEKIITY